MATQSKQDAVAAAIAEHLRNAATLMAAQSNAPAAAGSINEAEIIAKLDLILMKLDAPVVPLEQQLWTLADIARYLQKHTQTVRESMACLPSFPAAIRLPAKHNARSHPLYNAAEVIKWAETFKEKRRK